MIAKPLVAATDGSEESLRAVEWAAREAVVRGAPLRIVSAVQVPAMIGLQVRPDRDFVADLIHHERDQASAPRQPGPPRWPLACRSIPSRCPARPHRRSPEADRAR